MRKDIKEISRNQNPEKVTSKRLKKTVQASLEANGMTCNSSADTEPPEGDVFHSFFTKGRCGKDLIGKTET